MNKMFVRKQCLQFAELIRKQVGHRNAKYVEALNDRCQHGQSRATNVNLVVLVALQ